MTQEYPSQTDPAGPEQREPVAEPGSGTEEHDASTPATGPQESRTREVLREAIHKVTEEIDYHEQEAQKHLQQAAELRRDLRESLRFLQEQARKAQPSVVPSDGPSVKNPESSPVKDRPATA